MSKKDPRLARHFFLADFFALDFALGFDGFAFLGFNAFTGLALTVFGFLAFFGAAAGFFLAFLAAALGFLAEDLVAAFLDLAAFLGVVAFLTSFLAFLAGGGFLGSSALARRKEPDAPTPLVCLRTPVVTSLLMANLIWKSAFSPTL